MVTLICISVLLLILSIIVFRRAGKFFSLTAEVLKGLSRISENAKGTFQAPKHDLVMNVSTFDLLFRFKEYEKMLLAILNYVKEVEETKLNHETIIPALKEIRVRLNAQLSDGKHVGKKLTTDQKEIINATEDVVLQIGVLLYTSEKSYLYKLYQQAAYTLIKIRYIALFK